MNVSNGTWIVVVDGEKFLLLVNEGDEDFINLRIVTHDTHPNPPTHDYGTHAPGRFEDAGVAGKSQPGGSADNARVGKSAVEQTDWHQLEKKRFAEDLADRLKAWALQDKFDSLIVIADPHTLGVLRPAFHSEVDKRIVAEIDKDLTNHPVDGIEKVLSQF